MVKAVSPGLGLWRLVLFRFASCPLQFVEHDLLDESGNARLLGQNEDAELDLSRFEEGPSYLTPKPGAHQPAGGDPHLDDGSDIRLTVPGQHRAPLGKVLNDSWPQRAAVLRDLGIGAEVNPGVLATLNAFPSQTQHNE